MSAGDRDKLALTELLDEHRYRDKLLDCSCGEWKAAPVSSNVKWDKQHRAHLADVITSSDWLRERDAEKWDEGYDARDNHDFRYLPGCENPYHPTEATDE